MNETVSTLMAEAVPMSDDWPMVHRETASGDDIRRPSPVWDRSLVRGI